MLGYRSQRGGAGLQSVKRSAIFGGAAERIEESWLGLCRRFDLARLEGERLANEASGQDRLLIDDLKLALHDHTRADLDAVVEIDDIVIGQANAAGRVPGADRVRLVRTVDAVHGSAEIERARTERIV